MHDGDCGDADLARHALTAAQVVGISHSVLGSILQVFLSEAFLLDKGGRSIWALLLRGWDSAPLLFLVSSVGASRHKLL